LIWDIASAGVSKALILHKESLYFGGRDGFFYSLSEKTGSLNWKYYIGSELAGQALIKEDRLYFLTQDQKLYALGLKGNLIWIHSHPFQSGHFNIKGNVSPLIKNDLIYAVFEKGVVKALKKEDASLIWINQLSTEIISSLRLSQNCLFVPTFKSHNYCLDTKTGKIISKSKEKSQFLFEDSNQWYRFFDGTLFAYNKLKDKSRKKSLISYEKDSPVLWKQSLADSSPFPPSFFEDYSIYGFLSYGKLQILKNKTGALIKEYPFGKGLAGPITIDPSDQSLYFLSVDSYLYKISLLTE